MFAKEAAALPPGAALAEMNAAGPVLAVANEGSQRAWLLPMASRKRQFNIGGPQSWHKTS